VGFGLRIHRPAQRRGLAALSIRRRTWPVWTLCGQHDKMRRALRVCAVSNRSLPSFSAHEGRKGRPGKRPMTTNWQLARAAMLLDETVPNLNTGSFGPLPRVVFDRVTRLRRRLAEEPMDFLVRELPPLLWEARAQLARFVGADPRRLIFTANVTAAIN